MTNTPKQPWEKVQRGLQWFLAYYKSLAIRYFVVGICIWLWVMLWVFIGWLFEIDQDKRNALIIAIPVFAMFAYGLCSHGS